MKTKLVFLLMFAFGSVGISLKTQQEDYKCNLPASLWQSRLNYIVEWFEDGFCGHDIRIGVFANRFPLQNTTLSLVSDGFVVLPPDQSGNWSNEENSPRIANSLRALYEISPGATVYFYYQDLNLSSIDFSTGWRWFQDNDVKIVVNLVVYPLFTEDEVDGLNGLMKEARDTGVLWLNSSGNYGNSYYESSLISSSQALTWGTHYFALEGGMGLLPVMIADAHEPAGALIKWDNELANFALAAYADPDATVSLGYQSAQTNYQFNALEFENITPGQTIYLALTDVQINERLRIPISNNEENVQFALYLSNAVLVGKTEANSNSIPSPNDSPLAVTIGTLPYQIGNSSLTSSKSRNKPEITTYGTIDDHPDTVNSSGVATAVIAGITAIYWSTGSHYEQYTLDQMINFLTPDVAAEVVVIAPIPSNIPPIVLEIFRNLGILVVVLMMAFIIYFIYWDYHRIVREFDEMKVECRFIADGDSTVEFNLRLPTSRFNRVEIGRYLKKLTIELTFSPDLNGAPCIDSKLSDIKIIRNYARNLDLFNFIPVLSSFLSWIIPQQGIEEPIFRPELFNSKENKQAIILYPKFLTFNGTQESLVWNVMNLRWTENIAAVKITMTIYTGRKQLLSHDYSLERPKKSAKKADNRRISQS